MKRARILIADDSDKLLTALQAHLKQYGFEVMTCTDAYMALAHARKSNPDLMIVDIRMPAGNGLSVLERMGKIPELCHTPVICMTGDRSAELELQAEQLGAFGFLHKPISFPAMLELMDRALASECMRAPKESGDETVWKIPDPSGNP